MSEKESGASEIDARRPRSAGWVKAILLLVYVLTLLEISSRLFWRIEGVPFFSAQRQILYYFYPALREARQLFQETPGPAFEILMLGGSVLHKDFGDIERRLLETVTYRTRKPVRIYNLAMMGHTAVDSYYKYRSLSDKRFNLVMVYDGINEVRANNCPDDVFRDDFTHYSWYMRIHLLETVFQSRWFVAPYTAQFSWIGLTEELGWTEYVPQHKPKESWLRYGGRVKTAGPFREYLTRIMQLAMQKKEPVLLMTVGFHLPEGDPKERYRRTALWGYPDNVVRGFTEHNKVIEGIAKSHNHVSFVDQNRLIPKDSEHFADLVHLTQTGRRRFVENIVDVVVGLVNQG